MVAKIKESRNGRNRRRSKRGSEGKKETGLLYVDSPTRNPVARSWRRLPFPLPVSPGRSSRPWIFKVSVRIPFPVTLSQAFRSWSRSFIPGKTDDSLGSVRGFSEPRWGFSFLFFLERREHIQSGRELLWGCFTSLFLILDPIRQRSKTSKHREL